MRLLMSLFQQPGTHTYIYKCKKGSFRVSIPRMILPVTSCIFSEPWRMGAIQEAVVLALCLSNVLSEPAEDCGQGENYWCTDITTAARCQALRYCAANVWMPNILPKDGDVCGMCRQITDDMNLLLEGNQQFKEMSKACEMMGICRGESQDETLRFQSQGGADQVESNPSKFCKDCEAFLTDVKQYLAKPEVTIKIVQTLNEGCKLLGSLAQECKLAVQQAVPLMIQMITSKMDPKTMCGMRAMCPKTMQDGAEQDKTDISWFLHNPTIANLEVEVGLEGLECMACSLIIGEIQSLLGGKSTREAIISALDTVCDLIPFGFSSECRTMVDDYGSKLINMLLHGWSAHQICTSLFMCATVENKEEIIDWTNIQPSGGDVSPVQGGGCVVCKELMQILKQTLKGKTTKEAVEKALDHVCDDLGMFKSMCHDVVSRYSQALVDAIVSGMDLDKVCAHIGLCGTPTEAMQQTPVTSDGHNPPSCPLCRKIMSQMKVILKGKTDKVTVGAALGKVCLQLAGPLQHQCGHIVHEYNWQLTNSIVAGTDLEKVCSSIGLCACNVCGMVAKKLQSTLKGDRTKDSVRRAVSHVCESFGSTPYYRQCEGLMHENHNTFVDRIVDGVAFSELCYVTHVCTAGLVETPDVTVEKHGGCTLCKIVMKDLKNVLKGQKSKAEVQAALGKVCERIPGYFRKKCRKLIKKYSDKIVDSIVNGMELDKVCSKIGICTVKSNPDVFEANGGKSCSVCVRVLKEVDQFLQNKLVQEMIVNVLDKICGELGSYAAQCKNLMNTYGPKTLTFLANEIQPTQVCKMIRLCQAG